MFPGSQILTSANAESTVGLYTGKYFTETRMSTLTPVYFPFSLPWDLARSIFS